MGRRGGGGVGGGRGGARNDTSVLLEIKEGGDGLANWLSRLESRPDTLAALITLSSA
jgi:hypothetical protein